jgi:hypothetical protein
MTFLKYTILSSILCLGACGDDAGGAGSGADASTSGEVDASVNPNLPDAAPPVTLYTELWYSVDDRLVRVVLDTADGSVVEFQQTTLMGLALGQNAITMLDDGSILGARLSDSDNLSYLYHIASPPRDGGAVTPTLLGVMADDLRLEGLYTDCDGRVYAMDTGTDNSSSDGNRLLRFTGNPLASDFSYQVVSDLSSATVADIDDMGPAIVGNEIIDNPGLAIDSGTVYNFDYQTGTGTESGAGGTWGIHALGKELFVDGIARLYVLNKDAELFEMDPTNSTLSAVLGTGPTDVMGYSGWSGLAGPLTECDSGFEID